MIYTAVYHHYHWILMRTYDFQTHSNYEMNTVYNISHEMIQLQSRVCGFDIRDHQSLLTLEVTERVVNLLLLPLLLDTQNFQPH